MDKDLNLICFHCKRQFDNSCRGFIEDEMSFEKKCKYFIPLKDK